MPMSTASPSALIPRARIPALDITRLAALVAMALFHFVFDLEIFGYVAPGTVATGVWRALAVASAGSFVFLAGVGLWLAHAEAIRWAAFGRRIVIIAALAIAVFFSPEIAQSPAFNAPWLWWTGLQTLPLSIVDYEPIFPWFATFLAGLAASKLATRVGFWERISTTKPSRAVRLASPPGRHPLLIYPIHQPILIAIVWSATQLLR